MILNTNNLRPGNWILHLTDRMQQPNLYRVLKIDDYSATPKYVQILNAIIKGIEVLSLEEGFLLPSINDMSYELDVSRDTVEKAYRRLKKMGIIGSIQGKGYFISKTDYTPSAKILMMFNKLSVHKKIIYDEFVAVLGDNVAIDLYVYNNDFSLFKRILEQRREGYSHYVIIPHFLEGGDKAAEVINQLTEAKLILLDKKVPGITIPFCCVYENFGQDIYKALEEALPALRNYRTINMVFPSYSYFPTEILTGFRQFCRENNFPFHILPGLQEKVICPGEVFINLMEEDLIDLLERISGAGLLVGQDVGIISYNETPWKKFILSGITTISSDFKKMGQLTAEIVLENLTGYFEVPFHLILRPSLHRGE